MTALLNTVEGGISRGFPGQILFSVLVAFSGTAFAGAVRTVPELDAGSMLSGLTLLAGGILIATNRVRRK